MEPDSRADIVVEIGSSSMQVEPASKKQRVERAPIVKQWEEIVAQISGGSDEVVQLTLVPCVNGILTVGAKVQQWGNSLKSKRCFSMPRKTLQ